MAQLGFSPLLEKRPLLFTRTLNRCWPKRQCIPTEYAKKRKKSAIFSKGFLLVLQLFIALCFCLPCSPGFLLTLRTPKMATFMSPIFLPEHLVQHTVIDLLSFLLVFCKGQRYTADMPQCRSCQHEK